MEELHILSSGILCLLRCGHLVLLSASCFTVDENTLSWYTQHEKVKFTVCKASIKLS